MATNAVYQKAGTAITWTDSGGDLALTLNALAAGAGRQGAQKDWGVLTAPRPTRYHIRVTVQFNTQPVLGETVDVYWKSGDGTDYDNDDGTGNIALSSTDKLKNLTYLGSVIVDQQTLNIDMGFQTTFEDFNRYGMPVIHNNTADALENTANTGQVVVTPIFDDIQAAA